MKKNKMVFFIYSVLKKSLPIWFVFLLFLLSKGLNYTEAVLLDSFSAFTAIVFEIPSGILADKMSRKKLIVLGEIAIISNYIFLLCSHSYLCFVFGALISGIGQACLSGTGEAMIYDEINDETAYKSYMGQINKYGYFVIAGITLSSSWLFELNSNLPMIISILFEIISVLVLGFFYEEKRENRVNEFKGLKEEFSAQITIIKKYTTNSRILFITGLSLIMLEVISNLNYTTQAYLPSIGLDVRYLGLVLVFFNIISAFGAKVTEKIKLNEVIWILIYIMLLLMVSLPYMGIVLVALCVSRYINGFIWTIISAETNKQIESTERATALSFVNLITDLLPMLIDPLIAMSYDKYGFPITYRILAFSLLIIVLITSYTRNKKK
ncbi:MFS transporter [Butyrivibrio sp. NC3005]|uniref:MFS transporter n=1 Tax=Butyrivibrio sp. NC3005 TaxID=1280685 RepID=UPI00047C7A07|nr:MFS transporter [Butyrivibrio sp. NC3005]